MWEDQGVSSASDKLARVRFPADEEFQSATRGENPNESYGGATSGRGLDKQTTFGGGGAAAAAVLRLLPLHFAGVRR